MTVVLRLRLLHHYTSKHTCALQYRNNVAVSTLRLRGQETLVVARFPLIANVGELLKLLKLCNAHPTSYWVLFWLLQKHRRQRWVEVEAESLRKGSRLHRSGHLLWVWANFQTLSSSFSPDWIFVQILHQMITSHSFFLPFLLSEVTQTVSPSCSLSLLGKLSASVDFYFCDLHPLQQPPAPTPWPTALGFYCDQTIVK